MKTGDNYHKIKYSAVNKINQLWFTYGNGLHVKIYINFMTIKVWVVKFRDGKNVAESIFNVELQAGGQETVDNMVEKQMISALKTCGADLHFEKG